jgi:hypothetical protein
MVHKIGNWHHFPPLPLVSEIDIGDGDIINLDRAEIGVESAIEALMSLNQHDVARIKRKTKFFLNFSKATFYRGLAAFAASAG